jgi:hypothetical protein
MHLIKVRMLTYAVSACLLGFTAVSARANSVTYDFTYDGTGTYESETVTGNGSFTATFTPGSTTGTLTAFSLTDTFDDLTAGATSVFTYTNDATGTIKFAASSPYALTNVTLQTAYVEGSNSAFGAADFVLNYSPEIFDSTSGNGAQNPRPTLYFADFSSGGGTLTLAPAATVPEPASVGLLALPLLAIGFFYRSRRRQTLAS